MANTINKSFIIIVVLLVAYLLYSLSPILTPFLIAAILSYLANPIVEKLHAWRVPRLLSVIIVFLMLFSIIIIAILGIIPLIQDQILHLVDTIPNVIAYVQNTMMPWLATNFGVNEVININTVKATLAENWTKAGGVASWLIKTVFHSGLAIVEIITNFILIPVVTFYLLRDWQIVLKNSRNLIPRHIEPTIMKLFKQCDEVLSAFFRGQFLVMLSLGIYYAIGLTIVGLQIGLIIGLVIGLVSIVPYLGIILGITVASIAAYVQFGTFNHVLLVWLVFAIGQSLESTVLTPKLVGSRIGLHPVAVIFAVLAGGTLFGFFGVLLALPVASVIMVLLRFINQQYRHSRLYQ